MCTKSDKGGFRCSQRNDRSRRSGENHSQAKLEFGAAPSYPAATKSLSPETVDFAVTHPIVDLARLPLYVVANWPHSGRQRCSDGSVALASHRQRRLGLHGVGALLALAIGALVFAAACLAGTVVDAAPQSCILCDKGDLQASDPGTNYEEFLFEHQVTRQDAIGALRALNDSFFDGPASDSACKSVVCTKSVMRYCQGPKFINDHCWCELGHTEEGLPYIPHICYVGEKKYEATVGSCFFYEEVKECCCAPTLAREWRHISSVGNPLNQRLINLPLLGVALLVAALSGAGIVI